ASSIPPFLARCTALRKGALRASVLTPPNPARFRPGPRRASRLFGSALPASRLVRVISPFSHVIGFRNFLDLALGLARFLTCRSSFGYARNRHTPPKRYPSPS